MTKWKRKKKDQEQGHSRWSCSKSFGWCFLSATSPSKQSEFFLEPGKPRMYVSLRMHTYECNVYECLFFSDSAAAVMSKYHIVRKNAFAANCMYKSSTYLIAKQVNPVQDGLDTNYTHPTWPLTKLSKQLTHEQ